MFNGFYHKPKKIQIFDQTPKHVKEFDKINIKI